MHTSSYTNPHFNIKERPIFLRDTALYGVMITRIHQGAQCSNPRTYCGTHHSLETRDTKDKIQHIACNLKTKMDYSGSSAEETEKKKMFTLASKAGLAVENGMKAIFFRDLATDEPQSRKKKQEDSNTVYESFPSFANSTNNAFLNPMPSQSYGFSNMYGSIANTPSFPPQNSGFSSLFNYNQNPQAFHPASNIYNQMPNPFNANNPISYGPQSSFANPRNLPQQAVNNIPSP